MYIVTSQCSVGSMLTNAGEPLSGDGVQYINLNNPAQCRGNLTAWHLCYYPRATSDGAFSVRLRVWRPAASQGSLYSRHSSAEITITPSLNSGEELLVCEDITLAAEDYIQVERDDVIGIYIPESSFSSVSTIGVFNNPPPPGAGIYRDRRSSLITLISGSVERSDLVMLRTAGLHLYADIGMSHTVTLAKHMSQCYTLLQWIFIYIPSPHSSR